MMHIEEIVIIMMVVFFSTGMAFLLMPSKQLYSNLDYELEYNHTIQENKELQQKLDLCERYTGNTNSEWIYVFFILLLLGSMLLVNYYFMKKGEK